MRQRVDPFIPIQKKPRPPEGQYGSRYLRKPETSSSTSLKKDQTSTSSPLHSKTSHRSQAIEGIVRLSRPQSRQQTDSIKTTDIAAPSPFKMTHGAKLQSTRIPKPKPHKLAVRPLTRKLSQKAQLILVIVGAICIGLLIQSVYFGELVIGIYAVFAFTRHVASRTTFILALISLICIVLSLIVQGSGTQSDNFAAYAFLLLTVGTVSLGLEVHRDTARAKH